MQGPQMVRRGAPSTFVISHTPFHADGALDWDGLRAHLERFAAAGVGVYVGGGGSGEGYTLVDDEVDRLLATAVEVLAGRVPVRAMGVEPRTAAQMIEFGRQVQRSGIEIMQVYSLDMGHLAQPRAEELEAYFVEVLEAVDALGLRVVLSTHFSVGYMVPVDVLARLCERYPAVIGVNCSVSGDVPYLVRLLDELPPHVEVHVGGPQHALSALAMGATGFLSSEANLAPALAQQLVERYAAGDHAGAAVAYSQIMRVFTLTGLGVTGKALQRSLGLTGGYPRRPRLDLTSDAALHAAWDRLERWDVPELRAAVAASRRQAMPAGTTESG
jgi:4-hydroxy-tetrahydrodipicolinate synthase